jgi:hypothetical protein
LVAHRVCQAQPLTQRQCTNLLLEQALGELAAENPSDAELLRLRFCMRLPVEEARHQLHYAESTIYSKQNHAIAHLAAILYGLELRAWHERAAQLAGRLDTPSTSLVGVDKQIDHLTQLLKRPDGPWLLSIEGIGGIGKTSLAAEVMRHLAAETAYEEFGWVSAQLTGLDLCGEAYVRARPALTVEAMVAALAGQLLPPQEIRDEENLDQQLTLLRARLRQVPHLIIVDNFETVLDPQHLLPVLHSLANPTKFIITSRRRLIAEPSIHLHSVPELSVEHALLLVRQGAVRHDLPLLAAGADEDLLPIYTAVGGNPLALLLVIGQTHVRPLHAILSDLAKARTRIQNPALEKLFNYIYRQSWDGLSATDRRVLLAVCSTQVTDLEADSLGVVCGLDVAAITAALQRLIQANLVYMEGDWDTCRYRVHSLTYRFLQGVATKWWEEESACW